MAKPAKPAATPPRAKKPAAARKAKAAPAAVATPIEGPIEGGVLKTKDLLERVAARAATSKKEAKTIMDAVLHEIGASLGRGEGFALPAIGKAKVSRSADDDKGQKLVIKLKRGGPKKEGETPLAPAEE